MADQVRTESPEDGSPVDINDLAGVAMQLADWALARSTREAYLRAARAFDEWLGGRTEDDAALADYLGALFDRGLAAASAGTAVAALKERARRGGRPCPAGERTRQALCGYRRAGAGRGAGQVDGISWGEADRMAELAERRGPLDAGGDGGALHARAGRRGRRRGAAALRRGAVRRARDAAGPAPGDGGGGTGGSRSPEAGVQAPAQGGEARGEGGEKSAESACTGRNGRGSFLNSGFAEAIVTC